MSRFAPAVAAWMRQHLPWSNTRQAWQERLGVGGAIGAVLFGVFWVRTLHPVWQLIYWGMALTAAGLLLRRGWLKLFGPVLFFDLLCLARRIRYFLARTGYAAFLFLIVGWLWFAWTISGRFDNSRIDVIADFANGIFEVFVSVQFILVTLLTPVYTASAVADEKERRTLEFLLATDLRNREIVLSKLLARFLNLGMLILAGLPILALLQFMGGVDPDLVLASYAATVATVASLACLGMFFSVLVRRGRDAILLTYLCAFAYFVSWGFQHAIPASWRTFPSATSPITLHDVLEWYNAGNILHAIQSVGYLSFRPGVSVSDALPAALRGYLIFHGLLALVCTVWAVLRLRATALKETYARPRRVRLGVRLFGRPAVGDHPMVWKEVFADPGLHLHWIGRVIVVLLFLASFYPVVLILDEYLTGPMYMWQGWDPLEHLAEQMNIWGRVAGAMVGTLLLVAVAVRAAGSITGERDRQTFDSLLTSPLDSNAILAGKWLGSVLSMRRGWLWLGAIYGLTFVTGGVNFIGLLLVIAAWFVFAGFVAVVGLWFSTSSRTTTMRATVKTLLVIVLAFGGHWLLWTCCIPLLWTGGRGLDEMLSGLAQFQLFALTPPVTLGQLAFRASELESTRSSWNPLTHTVMAVIGIFIWIGFGYGLWAGVSSRLRYVTLRTPCLTHEAWVPPRRSLTRAKLLGDDIPTVEEV